MTGAEERSDAPVSVVVTRTALPGRESEYEAWLRRAIAAARTFPGHLGANVVRSPPRTFVLVFRFASLPELMAWEAAPERGALLEEAARLTEGAPVVHRVAGLETWFVVPGVAAPPPPRWKMAVVSWLVAFPTIQVLGLALGPALAPLPALVRGALQGAVMVLFLTYVGMPLAARALRGWLYPPAR